jgi:hypothetical protein
MPTYTEISLRLPNSPGALTRVCRVLADERVGILALMLDAGGELRVVVDNHVRALGALRERHQVSSREVVVLNVSNTAGALAPVASLVADAGINVEYAYGGARPDGGGALIVLGVDDAARASAAAGV